MGVGLDRSKPQGLDVVVLTSAFLLFCGDEFTSWRLLPSWRGLILRMIEIIRFSAGALFQWMGLIGSQIFFVSCFVLGWIMLRSFCWVELNFGPLGSSDFVGGGSW
jgi:hypothetical protein